MEVGTKHFQCNRAIVPAAAQQAVHFIGMPEGFFPLAEATIYLATAPKSNSAGDAYGRAMEDARATLAEPVPLHLRNAVTGLMREVGYGQGYRYAHDDPKAKDEMECLPPSLRGRRYLPRTDRGG